MTCWKRSTSCVRGMVRGLALRQLVLARSYWPKAACSTGVKLRRHGGSRRRSGSVIRTHRVVVPSGSIVTAGAALSHLDLALWLIRGNSPELAALVAKYLVFDSRLSQTGYVISDHLAHSDPLIERFDRWVRGRLDSVITLDSIAEALGTSKRTLSRRLDAVLGKTPIEYIQDLRIESAVHLLKTSNHSVDRIAGQVGYADGVTLRTLLRKRLGKGIRELRSRE